MGEVRRRGAVLEAAIREAVLGELSEHGYGGTTYEGVAARAGTSKPVLYRRWSTKAEMVAAASAAQITLFDPADTGNLRDDLRSLLQQARSFMNNVDRATLLTLMANLPPEVSASLRLLLLEGEVRLLHPILERARKRGELGPRALPDRSMYLPLDLVRHEYMVFGPASDDLIDQIVDHILIPLYVSETASIGKDL